MDFHNNFIGRKIWDDNTTYSSFLGAAIGLRRPSTSFLINATFGRVESSSCFVVSKKFLDPNLQNLHYTESETVQLILNTNITTAVYIRGPIADKLPRTSVTLDYSDCGGGIGSVELVNIDHIDGTMVSPDDPCIRRVYTTTYVNACFISKDPNYNPY